MQPALNDLDCILERQRNDGTLDFYVEKAAEEALAYAQEVESKELAAFFAYQALVDYSRQSIGLAEVESTVVIFRSLLGNSFRAANRWKNAAILCGRALHRASRALAWQAY